MEPHYKVHGILGILVLQVDPDLLLKPEIWDGVKYYLYSLCYVDDILCIHHNADAVLEWLHESFPLKLGFGNPDMHIGAKLSPPSLLLFCRFLLKCG